MTTATGDLAHILIDTWRRQGEVGFLLTDPQSARIATREVLDDACGVKFRFRWMPHREIRGDVQELERRGILNPDRNAGKMFADPRDPQRHCFLCPENIREAHPMEELVPVTLGGREYFAGANFAWIEENHYTVMAAEHADQVYSRHSLDAMRELHDRTDRRFRVIFNGPGAGASIPWHLHYQITTEPLPIEQMPDGAASSYPTVVWTFDGDAAGVDKVHRAIQDWEQLDPENYTVNVVIATTDDRTRVFVFPRDRRRSHARTKGLVGGFEVAGDFVLSAPHEEVAYQRASVDIARSILECIRPPAHD